jgi:SAM-dependent methyltransferase
MKNQAFWSSYQPGFRFARHRIGSREFFDEVTAYRYEMEPHVPDVVDFPRWMGCDVLEAGCGIGTDGVRFAACGARYTGLDFSPTALDLARRRFELDGLPGRFVHGSVTALPFEDESFDLVFSHGVIHHVDDTEDAVREFHRVLKPGGTALVMVYNRGSFNYHVTIMGVRRALVTLLSVPRAIKVVAAVTHEPEDVLAGHAELLASHGRRYITDRALFLSHNTDGPGNALTKVYSAEAMREMLAAAGFQGLTTDVRYLNLRLYPGDHRRTAPGQAPGLAPLCAGPQEGARRRRA